MGTAQLTGKYGITNHCNKNSEKKMLGFLDFCYQNSFTNFDTAFNYGSEKIIGKFIKINNIKNINLSTKVPSLKEIKNSKKLQYIKSCLEQMSNNLNVNNIQTVYFHDENDLNFFKLNAREILKIKNFYRVQNLGFSIYSKKSLDKIEKIIQIKTVQLPMNILNSEFYKTISKKIIVARSIFLQGLLINPNLKSRNKILNNFSNKLINFSKENKVDLYNLCLSFVLSNKRVKKIVLGFDSIKQVKKLLNFKCSSVNEDDLAFIQKILNKKDLDFIKDPRKW